MILAVCVDDYDCLQFNHRRQSRDSAVIDDLIRSAEKLWIHPRSASLFAENAAVFVNRTFLSVAGTGEWCLIEDLEYLQYTDRIEKIILYRWNRAYPRDMIFEFPGQWRLEESRDFVGSSHERITREVYVR